jgi:putative protein-disulfide isomerase
MSSTPRGTAEVLYVFDGYCGWCYGFDETLIAFWRATRDRVPFRVISGGLFTGSNKPRLGTLGFIRDANARVTQYTGARFGDGFDAVLRDGSLVLDSDGAAAGFAALRAQAPERAVELAAAMQRAFYLDGRSLSDPDTFVDLARACGLDSAPVRDFMTGPDGGLAAAEDFALARALGARSFPTLLVARDGALVPLPRIGASVAMLTRHLDAALTDRAAS